MQLFKIAVLLLAIATCCFAEDIYLRNGAKQCKIVSGNIYSGTCTYKVYVSTFSGIHHITDSDYRTVTVTQPKQK